MLHKATMRAEVPAQLTWNLDDLFVSQEDWEKELNSIVHDLPGLTKYKGKLGDSAATLLACLLADEALMLRWIRVSTYASLRASEDGINPLNQSNSELVAGASAELSAARSFITSEIIALQDGVVQQFQDQEPELKVFAKFFEELQDQKPYQLSPETEQALAGLQELTSSPYKIYQRGKSSDMRFAPVVNKDGQEEPMTFALYEDRYEFTPDNDLRRRANQSFVETLEQYKNTFAAAYSTEVKKQVAMAKLRGYESVTQMLLHGQKVTEQMYNNQLDVIFHELAPHMRKYAKLKKQRLGVETMLHCDLKVPLDPGFSPKTTIEEAGKVIIEALSVMGDEYRTIMETALSQRWVDYPENAGKSTGAFCSSPYGVHPYILITWTDTMRGGFVLAHELGHAGHFALAQRNQRLTNTRPSTYFVEAPSTMNEMLLGNHILQQSSDARMRRWVVEQLLGTYYHNFVTHLLEGEFQRRVYRHAEAGGALTAVTLRKMKGDVLREFWGDAVHIDSGAELTWMRQPHYYMGLYPYTYSAGLTISTLASQMILKEGQPAVDRWLSVLKAGGTLSPLELAKLAGIDMSTPDAVRQAVAHVGSLVDEVIASY